jgi:anti-sigma regulatory factor (Ser/Thr protein kinase)
MTNTPKPGSWDAETPDALLELLSELAVPPSRKRAIADAMRELYANAIQHGAQPVKVTLSFSMTDISLTVEDAGGNLNPELVSRADQEAPLQVQFDKHGAGIGLARSIRSADSVEVDIIPDRKTQVTLSWSIIGC